MKRAPPRDRIHAAELRVAQCKKNMLDGYCRVPAAFKAAVTRPTSLMVVFGAAGLVGFRLARRSRATSLTADSLNVAARPAVAGVVAAFIARYGIRYLTSLFREVWAARTEIVAQTGVTGSKSSTTVNATPGSPQ